MINIEETDKANCCGCSACVQSCPKNCISLQKDIEGFYYPKVNLSQCVNCGKCEKVCPELSLRKEEPYLKSYIAINNDKDQLIHSSSGGVFSAMAEYVLKRGGVVFGAKFNSDWSVSHDYIESKDDLRKLQGSKYVQSEIKLSFTSVLQFLKNNRLVLFSGTPCQIAGLKCYLGKEYSNLILVDIICHGVPSPMVWLKYVDFFLDKADLIGVDFRCKIPRWDKYSFCYKKSDGKVISDPSFKNLYLRGFLSDLFLRPSCYNCFFKCNSSGSDCTIGDYWGIRNIMPDLEVDLGCSAVLVSTNKGLGMLAKSNTKLIDSAYSDVLKYNPSLEKSSSVDPTSRNKFFQELISGDFREVFTHYFTLRKWSRIKIFILNILKKYIR